jgi:hypothetical protein
MKVRRNLQLETTDILLWTIFFYFDSESLS